MSDPADDILRHLNLARRDFRAVTGTIIKTITFDAEALAGAIGDISFEEAYDAWVRKVKYLLEPMKGN